MIDITYPESYMRTPLPLLPFSAPKWLLEYSRGAGYAPVRSCLVELYDDDVDEADIVRESIEPRDEEVMVKKEKDIWGNGTRGWNGGRKRRFDSENADEVDITFARPVQKLKRE